MSECGLIDRVATPAGARLVLARTHGEDAGRPGSSAHDYVLRPGRAVDEIPLPQGSLIALDDQQRVAEEDEKILLIGFPVVHPHRLAGSQHEEVDADLREVGLAIERQARAAPVAVEPARLSRVEHEPALPGGHEPGLGLLDEVLPNHRPILEAIASA